MYDTVHVLNMYMCMCGGGKDEIYVYAHVPLFHITFYYHHSIQYELMGLYCCVRLLLIFFFFRGAFSCGCCRFIIHIIRCMSQWFCNCFCCNRTEVKLVKKAQPRTRNKKSNDKYSQRMKIKALT